jgi:hypothetical protein
MGYRIRIGNLDRDEPYDEKLSDHKVDLLVHRNAPRPNGDVPSFHWLIHGVTIRDAGSEGDLLGCNTRHPSYYWDVFLREVGLFDLFFGKEHGILPEHAGIACLTVDHAAIIRQALERYRAAHPDAKPGFNGIEGLRWTEGTLDGNLSRILWLSWWVDWAVENCPNPVIEIR